MMIFGHQCLFTQHPFLNFIFLWAVEDTQTVPFSSTPWSKYNKTSKIWMCVCVKLLQLCLTLYDLMDCSPPGSSVHGILQARILEWIACPPPGDLPDPGIKPASFMSLALAGRFFTTSTTWEALNLNIPGYYKYTKVLANTIGKSV